MYRILLVDDEILVRDAIKENIDWQSMDCELVGDCENGKQAAEFVQEHPVDIVLTDILMPYMDGMELSHFLHFRCLHVSYVFRADISFRSSWGSKWHIAYRLDVMCYQVIVLFLLLEAWMKFQFTGCRFDFH